jgi:hypothetical protein
VLRPIEPVEPRMAMRLMLNKFVEPNFYFTRYQGRAGGKTAAM